MICNASYDCSVGRYSKFLMWSLDEISEFFKYCEEVGINYFESSDTERWALEDSFDMS